MFEKLKSLFQNQQASSSVIEITSASNHSNLPDGFFIVETASGKKTLGYHDPQTKSVGWDVGTTVVVGARRVTLDPQINLPVVRLTFRRDQPGMARVGNHRIMDTGDIGWDGAVGWDGPKPNTPDGWV